MSASCSATTFLVQRTGIVAMGLCLVFAAGLIVLPSLQFDADINRVFLTDSPRSDAQRAFEARFGEATTDVAIFVEAEGQLGADHLAAARNLALDLELTDGVTSVASPFALRFPLNDPRYPDAPLLPDALNMDEVATRLDDFREMESGLPLLLTDDSLLIVARVNTDSRPLPAILEEVRGLSATLYDAGLRTTVTGEKVISLAIADGLKSDLLRLNALGVAIVTLMAFLLLRDVRSTVVAVIPAFVSSVLTLAVAPAFGYPLTVINNVIPVLVLILGVANGLHLTMHLRRADGTTEERIAETLQIVGPAVLLTALTTAIAFASILLNPNPQLFELSVMGTAGMVVAMVVLLPGFSVLARAIPPARRDDVTRMSDIAIRLGRTSLARSKAIVATGAVLLALSGGAFLMLTPWFPLYENLPSGSRLSDANDRIAEAYGGVFMVWVDMPNGADWPSLQGAVSSVESVVGEGAVLSEVALARWSGDADTQPRPDLLERLPDDISARLRDGDQPRFSVNLPEPMRSPETLAAYDKMEQAALSAGAERVFGLPAIMRHEALDLVGDLSISLVAACLTGAVVLTLWFGGVTLFPVALAVNVLPVLVVGAALYLLDNGYLTPPAVLSLTIAFGVAIDDTVHFISRYRDALRLGQEQGQALEHAMSSAGGVMILTSILLCAGLSVTLLSGFHPVRLFGSMMMLTLAVAILADLALLPCLLKLTDRHHET